MAVLCQQGHSWTSRSYQSQPLLLLMLSRITSCVIPELSGTSSACLQMQAAGTPGFIELCCCWRSMGQPMYAKAGLLVGHAACSLRC